MEKWSSTLFVAMLFVNSWGVNDVFVTEETCGQESVYVFAFENPNWIGYFDKNILVCHLQPVLLCTAVIVATENYTAEDMKQVGAKSLITLLYERSKFWEG